MSDISTAAGGGVVGAAFMAGVNWATSFFKGKQSENGNGNHGESNAVLVERMHNFKESLDKMAGVVNETSRTVNILSGNVATITRILAKHEKEERE